MAMAGSPLTVMGTHPLIRRLLRYLLPRLSSSSSRRSYSLRRPRRFPPPQPTTGIIAASLTAIIPTSKIALAAGCKWRLSQFNKQKIMIERLLKLFPLLAICSLAGCVSMPTGPSMMALPGNGRSFDEFRYDDYVCRQFAYEQAGGTPSRASVVSGVGSAAVGAGLGAAAGAALGGGQGAAIGAGTGMLAGGLAGANTARSSGSISQQRYDMGYTQCMYAKGHRVPVAGQIQYSPANPYSSAPSAPSAPSMPPPPPGRPQALPPGVPPPPPGIPPPPPPG
jgi:hypothetical protein